MDWCFERCSKFSPVGGLIAVSLSSKVPLWCGHHISSALILDEPLLCPLAASLPSAFIVPFVKPAAPVDNASAVESCAVVISEKQLRQIEKCGEYSDQGTTHTDQAL